MQASQQTAVVRIQRSFAHPLTQNPNGIQHDQLAHGQSTHQNRMNFLIQARPFLGAGPVQRLGAYHRPVFQVDPHPLPEQRLPISRFSTPSSDLSDTPPMGLPEGSISDSSSYRAGTPDSDHRGNLDINESVYSDEAGLADASSLERQEQNQRQERKINALTHELATMRQLIQVLENRLKDQAYLQLPPVDYDGANNYPEPAQDELTSARRRIASLEQQITQLERHLEGRQTLPQPLPPPPPPPPLPNFGGNVSLKEITQADIAGQRKLLKKAGVIRGNEVQDADIDLRGQLLKDLKIKLTGKKEEVESGVTSNTINLISLLERANEADLDPKPYFKALINDSSVFIRPYNFSQVDLGIIFDVHNTTGDAEFDETASLPAPVQKIDLTLPAKRMAVDVKKVNGQEVRRYPYAEACAKVYLEKLTELQALADPNVPVPIHVPIAADKLPSAEEVRVFTDILTSGIEDAALTMPIHLYICTKTRTIKGYFLKDLFNIYLNDIEQPS